MGYTVTDRVTPVKKNITEKYYRLNSIAFLTMMNTV